MTGTCRVHRLSVFATITALLFAPGCSRRFWREQAEQDTYDAVNEKLDDQRWAVPRFEVTPDTRSRFYDPYDPDQEPLPPDDPAAHEFMHRANGIKGYQSWHKFGDTMSVENPHWLESFGVSLDSTGQVSPVEAHTSVQLQEITLPEAIELSYIHSREYQTAIEDLYLSALSLTFQRFQFGVRYLGGSGREPGATYNSTHRPGQDSFSLGNNFGISQSLPAGGQWAVDLANNTMWLFGTGGGTPVSSSNLGFSLVQPLLFRAGRKVAMENLTQAERNVLYSARTLARFRKVFFADTATGYLRILQQRQAIINTEGNIQRLKDQIEIQTVRDSRRPFQVPAELRDLPADLKIPEDLQDRLVYDEVDGFLFWRDQSITEEEAQRVLSLSQDPDYQRAASEIIELLRSDTTSLTALQLLTQVSNNENQLRDLERGLQDQQDAFKTQLGLPPDVGLEIDTSLLRPFELISPKLSATEAELQTVLTIVDRPLGQPADFSALRTFLSRLEVLAEQVTTNGFEQVQEEFKPVQELLDTGKSAATKRVFINDAEVERVRKDFARDKRLFSIARSEFDRAVRDLDRLMLLVDGDTAAAAFRKLDKDMDGKIEMQELDGVFDASLLKRLDINEDGEASVAELVDIVEAISRDIREEILRSAQSLQVLQAGLRTELVAVNRFTLNGSEETPTIHEVVKVALENRLDLMNSRAAVMDARRRLEIAANALESTLDIQVDGQLGTPPGGRNPFDFRQDQSRLDVGIQFTTPLDQIQERNDYAASLITYQRARRDYMRIEDQVKTQIRTSWRQLQVSEQQLEIDRQQIRQAALQFDNAAQQAARGGQNNALNLLNSIGALLNAQNRLIGDWIRYELNRLNIYRDMGIMEIDPRGIWTDEFYQQGQNFPAEPGLNPPSDTAPPLLNLDRDSIDEPKSDDVPPAPQASRGVDALDHVGYRVAGNRRHRGSSVVAKQSLGDVRLEGLRPIQSLHH